MSLRAPSWKRNLPGSDLIAIGLRDIKQRRKTALALLVSIGSPRLRRAGIQISRPFPSPEIQLYELLRKENPDNAHSQYNALIRRLVSFERAAECVR